MSSAALLTILFPGGGAALVAAWAVSERFLVLALWPVWVRMAVLLHIGFPITTRHRPAGNFHQNNYRPI